MYVYWKYNKKMGYPQNPMPKQSYHNLFMAEIAIGTNVQLIFKLGLCDRGEQPGLHPLKDAARVDEAICSWILVVDILGCGAIFRVPLIWHG